MIAGYRTDLGRPDSDDIVWRYAKVIDHRLPQPFAHRKDQIHAAIKLLFVSPRLCENLRDAFT